MSSAINNQCNYQYQPGDRPVKLLAIDLDGTLIAAKKPVSPRNIKAVRAARDAGIKIVFCTGRAIREAEPVRRQCFADGEEGYFMACLSGAHICSGFPPVTVATAAISREAAAAGMKAIHSTGLSAVALVDPCTAGFDNIMLAGEDERFVHERWLSYDDFRVRSIDSADELLDGDWPEILRLTAIVPNSDRSLADPAIAALKKVGVGLRVEPIYAPNLDIYVVECFTPGINKLRAVSKIAEICGIEISETAAVGDDINDLPMVSGVAVGVAMANACEAVMKAAKYKTESCEQDGLAKFIENLPLAWRLTSRP